MDRKLLSEILEKKGFTAEDAAAAMGISRATYFRKLATFGETLTVGQVQRLCNFLGLTDSEAHKIFFTPIVAYKRQPERR